MAISKIILNGVTQMDLTSDTVAASNLIAPNTAHGADGEAIVGTASAASEPNLQSKTNITPTESSQTITADSGYDGLSSVQINAMPTGTAGTPTATKGTVNNHSVSVTPSVTNTTGYITGGTKTGTAITVTASELASGNKAITENGTDIDVVGYSTISVDVDNEISITDVSNSTGTTAAISGEVTSGGTASVATGTFTGNGTTTATISCSFAPDIVYVYGDLTGSESNRGVISFIIIKDTICLVTNDGSTSGTSENIYGLSRSITDYGITSGPHATYSNGTLTLNMVVDSSSSRFTSGITYSYKLIKYTT